MRLCRLVADGGRRIVKLLWLPGFLEMDEAVTFPPKRTTGLVARGVAGFAGAVGQLLFPPVCAGCHAAVGRGHSVCATCWAGITFIEPPFCAVLGTPFAYDMGEGMLSPEAIAEPPPFARLRAAVLYDGLAARLVASLKYGDRTDLTVLMAGWMARAAHELVETADLVVPVPLHRGRLWRRRFNQAAELARLLVRVETRRGHAIAYAPTALVRGKATRSQVGLGREMRRANVRGAFAVPPRWKPSLAGKRVLLVDDVFTTGATVASATRALKRAGVAEVDVLCFARVAVGEGAVHI